MPLPSMKHINLIMLFLTALSPLWIILETRKCYITVFSLYPFSIILPQNNVVQWISYKTSTAEVPHLQLQRAESTPRSYSPSVNSTTMAFSHGIPQVGSHSPRECSNVLHKSKQVLSSWLHRAQEQLRVFFVFVPYFYGLLPRSRYYFAKFISQKGSGHANKKMINLQ